MAKMSLQEKLKQIRRLESPLKLTIKRKNKEDLNLYFETSSQAKLFEEFIKTLIKGVKEKQFQNLTVKLQGYDVSTWLFQNFPYYLYKERYTEEKQRVLAILEKFSKLVLGLLVDDSKVDALKKEVENHG